MHFFTPALTQAMSPMCVQDKTHIGDVDTELVSWLSRRQFVIARITVLRIFLELSKKRLEDDIENRDKEEIEESGESHASDYRSADRVTAIGACSGGEIERQDAEDEGNRGHQDRSKTQLGRDNRGIDDRLALLQLLFGKLHNENGIFRSEADEHDESYLDVHVVDKTTRGDKSKSTEDCHRNGEQNDERKGKAFILCGEGKVHDEQTKAKDDDGFTCRLNLFECKSCPGEGHALNLVLLK